LTQPGWGAGRQEAAAPRRRPVADIFDEAFRLYRENFRIMVIAFGAFQLPFVILSLPFWALQAQSWQAQPLRPPSTEQFGWLAAASFGIVLVGLPLGTFAGAAVAYVVRRARTGDRPEVRDVFQVLRREAGSILGFALLLLALFLGFGLLMAILALALVAIAGTGAGIGLAVIGGFVGLVVLVVVTTRLTLGIPALVVERRGPLNALRRSWALVAGSTMRTFGIFVLGSLVVGLLAGIVNPVYIPDVAAGLVAGSVWSYAVVGVVTGLAQVLVGPILPALLTVLYFDYAEGQERQRAG
jgi:hypothetical protein